ncbi:unnamed protein product [Amoebophrya sp. A25]|nr:unnamed protein product [Amoebophrya sp. A25]|eukprot:GSA25T00006155001.1
MGGGGKGKKGGKKGGGKHSLNNASKGGVDIAHSKNSHGEQNYGHDDDQKIEHEAGAIGGTSAAEGGEIEGVAASASTDKNNHGKGGKKGKSKKDFGFAKFKNESEKHTNDTHPSMAYRICRGHTPPTPNNSSNIFLRPQDQKSMQVRGSMKPDKYRTKNILAVGCGNMSFEAALCLSSHGISLDQCTLHCSVLDKNRDEFCKKYTLERAEETLRVLEASGQRYFFNVNAFELHDHLKKELAPQLRAQKEKEKRERERHPHLYTEAAELHEGSDNEEADEIAAEDQVPSYRLIFWNNPYPHEYSNPQEREPKEKGKKGRSKGFLKKGSRQLSQQTIDDIVSGKVQLADLTKFEREAYHANKDIFLERLQEEVERGTYLEQEEEEEALEDMSEEARLAKEEHKKKSTGERFVPEHWVRTELYPNFFRECRLIVEAQRAREAKRQEKKEVNWLVLEATGGAGYDDGSDPDSSDEAKPMGRISAEQREDCQVMLMMNQDQAFRTNLKESAREHGWILSEEVPFDPAQMQWYQSSYGDKRSTRQGANVSSYVSKETTRAYFFRLIKGVNGTENNRLAVPKLWSRRDYEAVVAATGEDQRAGDKDQKGSPRSRRIGHLAGTRLIQREKETKGKGREEDGDQQRKTWTTKNNILDIVFAAREPDQIRGISYENARRKLRLMFARAKQYMPGGEWLRASVYMKRIEKFILHAHYNDTYLSPQQARARQEAALTDNPSSSKQAGIVGAGGASSLVIEDDPGSPAAKRQKTNSLKELLLRNIKGGDEKAGAVTSTTSNVVSGNVDAIGLRPRPDQVLWKFMLENQCDACGDPPDSEQDAEQLELKTWRCLVDGQKWSFVSSCKANRKPGTALAGGAAEPPTQKRVRDMEMWCLDNFREFEIPVVLTVKNPHTHCLRLRTAFANCEFEERDPDSRIFHLVSRSIVDEEFRSTGNRS